MRIEMNEKIKELVEQAELTAIIDDSYLDRNVWQSFVEKFAELIVKECTNICNDGVVYSDYTLSSPSYMYYVGRLKCSSDIKKHFGVEE